MCGHKMQQPNCPSCRGVRICEHGVRRTRCVRCHGGSICPHNMRRDVCKLCKRLGRLRLPRQLSQATAYSAPCHWSAEPGVSCSTWPGPAFLIGGSAFLSPSDTVPTSAHIGAPTGMDTLGWAALEQQPGASWPLDTDPLTKAKGVDWATVAALESAARAAANTVVPAQHCDVLLAQVGSLLLSRTVGSERSWACCCTPSRHCSSPVPHPPQQAPHYDPTLFKVNAEFGAGHSARIHPCATPYKIIIEVVPSCAVRFQAMGGVTPIATPLAA